MWHCISADRGRPPQEGHISAGALITWEECYRQREQQAQWLSCGTSLVYFGNSEEVRVDQTVAGGEGEVKRTGLRLYMASQDIERT